MVEDSCVVSRWCVVVVGTTGGGWEGESSGEGNDRGRLMVEESCVASGCCVVVVGTTGRGLEGERGNNGRD